MCQAKFLTIWTLTPASPSSPLRCPQFRLGSLDILHFGLNLTYLKISGVFGLGGGSAACRTFRRNKGSQDHKGRRGERTDS